MNKIITISRDFGSGGREVGKRLADKLGSAYYDRELLEEIAKETNLSEDFIYKYDEADTRMFDFSFACSLAYYQQSPAMNMEIAQGKILKRIADKGDSVIIGRCADYILEDRKPFKVFIYASDIEYKIKRCMEKRESDKLLDIDGEGKEDFRQEITKIDKRRKKYYEGYTGQKWRDMKNYNLCIDTSIVGIKGAATIIEAAFKQWVKNVEVM